MVACAFLYFCVCFIPSYFRTFWIFQLELNILTSIVVYVVFILLLSNLLRRPGSVNAAETRRIPSCFGFMFHRRGALHRRLSRLAAHEAKRPVEALLKQLQVSQLEALAIAIESEGAEPAPCILLRAAELLRLGRSSPALPPHILFCKLFRWSDLVNDDELRPLPMCKNTDVGLLCCNPYHYCRLYKPDSPPPPYSRRVTQEFKFEESTRSDPVGFDTRFSSNLSSSSDSPRPWCKLAYWEMATRVGRLLPVSQASIDIFTDLPHGDGLCLETLAKSCLTDCSSVIQTRGKIGQGITIFREEKYVWMYNRSNYPVFVNSPTLDPPNVENLTVYKVLPGYCIKIFDFDISLANEMLHDPSLLKEGPIDLNAVRISFAKGWGPKYSRRFITSCPCWLEVMFLVNR